MKTCLYFAGGLVVAMLLGCTTTESRPSKPAEPQIDLAMFTEAEVLNAGFDPHTGSHMMLLRTKSSRRTETIVPIFVGDREAQVLQMKISGQISMRPMTHDLTVAMLEKLKARIEYAVVEAMQEGVFLARIFFRDADNTLHSLDCRASDAIILAITAGRKFYIHHDVVKAAGIKPEDDSESISI